MSASFNLDTGIMSEKNILIVLPPKEHFSPQRVGAVGLCVQDFVRHSCYQHNTLVIGSDAEGGFDGVAYQSVKCRKYGMLSHGLAYFWAVLRFVKTYGATLVEVHNRPRLAMMLFYGSKAVSQIALHLHNDPQEMAMARTAQQRSVLLSHMAIVYCVSDYIRSRLLEGVPEEYHVKAVVVHNGLEIPPVMSTQREKIIMFAGRLAQTKGGLEFAKALTQVLPQLDGWRGLVVGADRHAPSVSMNAYERELYTTLEALGDKVQMAGFMPHAEVMKAYDRAAIAVVPSQWHEPFGRTALEAMAHGAALIATASGGLMEVMGDAGVGIDPPSAETIAEAILRLVRDDVFRARIAQAGYVQAQTFEIAKVTKLLDDARQNLGI